MGMKVSGHNTTAPRLPLPPPPLPASNPEKAMAQSFI